MKTDEVCKAFADGESNLEASNVFIEGNVLYSYGRHFPLAIRLRMGEGFKFIFNNDKYSRTTSKHKTILLHYINKEDVIKECNTGEMNTIADSKVTSVKELMAKNLEDEAIK